jgi:hypothetical protein
MLVLAAGLMLALIINWNIDIGDTGGEAMSVSQGEESLRICRDWDRIALKMRWIILNMKKWASFTKTRLQVSCIW